MSLRTKVLLWIIAVNLGIAALLLTAIHGSIQAQRQAHLRTLETISENREEIITRLSNILSFEESLSRMEERDITTSSILSWNDWKYFDDAVVLKDYVEFENEIIYTDIELNPLGSRRRSPSFDREEALRMLKKAIAFDTRVTEGDAIAIPIHVMPTVPEPGEQGGAARYWNDLLFGGVSSRVWGAAFVRPRFPEIEEMDGAFDLTVFWVAMVGGTLVLITVTYVILSKLVIRPVEEMARVADRVARGDFSAHCAGPRTRDEVGRLTYSFNYMVDEVGDYHKHLQERIAEARERVRLAERHLTVAQRLASTGKLAAGIAHEINNPIGGMINAALRLKEEAPDGSRSEIYLSLIIEGLERIKRTVQNILAFSPRKVEPRPAELAAVLEDASAFISHRLKESGIRITTNLEPPDIAIVCEPGEIRQVFLNILINSVDAIANRGDAKSRKGSIDISAFRDPLEKTVIIEVRDSGCGMDAEQLHHAFDPFFSTKPSGEGSGLGLSIAHNIVTSHGGRIEAESEVGKGTTIRIVLPSE